jgi:signal peptidase I
MTDERGGRGRDVSETGGYPRTGQVDGYRAGPAGLDGAGEPGFQQGQPPTAQWPAGPAAANLPPAGPPSQAPYGGRPVPGSPGMSGEGHQPGDDGGPPAGGDGRARAMSPPRGPGELGPRMARRAERAKRRSGRSWWIELPILLVFALLLALLIKSFVVQAFYIPSSSMEHTLNIGDKVLVNKLVYDFRPIQRGDVVVFNGDGSWDPVPVEQAPPLVRLWDSIAGIFGTSPGVHDYIKRVIGVPGDHVACCDSKGRITVNGVPLSEKSYLFPGNAPSADRFDVTVPAGRLWVMGDHRSVSYDSRGHRADPGGGTIPEDRVVGRAFMIIAPVSRWRILPIPATFEQHKLLASTAAMAGPAGLPALAAQSAAAMAAGTPAGPSALGLLGAVPLTWLQRRLRRRFQARRVPGPGRRRHG